MDDTPLYIKSIHIEGLMGEKDFHWDLRQDVNILGGQNGSGKSTILRALYLLLKGGESLDQDKCGRLMESMAVELTNGNVHKWVKGNVYVDQQLYSLTRPVVDYINTFEQTLADAVYLSKKPNETREDDSTYLDELIKEALNKRNEIYAGALSMMLEMLKNGDHEINNHPILSGYNDLVEQCFKFFNYTSFEGTKLIFENSDGIEIPYTRLSMGQKQLLYILLKVTNMQKKPGILIMDEPDLAMHVEWQKVLLKSLRHLNPNMQLVVCTHAPRMITGWQECVKEVGQLTTNRAHHE